MAPRRRRQEEDPEEGGQSADEMIEGHTPGSGTGVKETGPLGVPEGYRAEVYRGPSSFGGMSPGALEAWEESWKRGGSPLGPRYFVGDEDKPASRGKDSIISMQLALIAGGYLGVDDPVRMGRWDPLTRNAYRRLLEEANASGRSAEATLIDAARAVPVGGSTEGPGGGRWEIDPETGMPVFVANEFVPPPQLPVRTTSRDDLRAVIRQVAQDRLGQGWGSQEVEEAVNMYQAEEVRFQNQMYQAEVDQARREWEGLAPADAPVIESPANPEAFFDEEARQRDPAGYAAGTIANDLAPAFFESLAGFV